MMGGVGHDDSAGGGELPISDLHALGHREGMGKTGVPTAGGGNAGFLCDGYKRPRTARRTAEAAVPT